MQSQDAWELLEGFPVAFPNIFTGFSFFKKSFKKPFLFVYPLLPFSKGKKEKKMGGEGQK